MAQIEKAKELAKAGRPAKIDVKQAVAIAVDYFRALFPEAAKANMMLEEIEESAEGHWMVTLGYDVDRPRSFVNGITRSYKTLRIDSVTGKVLSVKIRSVG